MLSLCPVDPNLSRFWVDITKVQTVIFFSSLFYFVYIKIIAVILKYREGERLSWAHTAVNRSVFLLACDWQQQQPPGLLLNQKWKLLELKLKLNLRNGDVDRMAVTVQNIRGRGRRRKLIINDIGSNGRSGIRGAVFGVRNRLQASVAWYQSTLHCRFAHPWRCPRFHRSLSLPHSLYLHFFFLALYYYSISLQNIISIFRLSC